MKLNLMIFILTFVLGPRVGVAQDKHSGEIDFFNGPIDYWSKPDRVKEGKEPKNAAKNVRDKKKGNGKFSWKEHLDPNNKEFFREGNHLPPAPFIELVKNPTDENIKKWFKYIELKNKLASNLQKRLQEYAEKKKGTLNEGEQDVLQKKIAQIPTARPDAKRYRFRLYVDSACPYCKKMLSTMAALNSMGYYVEVLQIDNNTTTLKGSPVVVKKADPTDVKKHRISAVPLLLVGDLEKRAVYRINGFQTVESILSQLRS